jgi:hypothetical protein
MRGNVTVPLASSGWQAPGEEVYPMHYLRVGLGISALAVAIIVVYGYIFGMQSTLVMSARTGGLLDFYYFAIIAMAAGALAAILVVRRGLSARHVLGDPIGYDIGYGLAYGAARHWTAS